MFAHASVAHLGHLGLRMLLWKSVDDFFDDVVLRTLSADDDEGRDCEAPETDLSSGP